MTDKQIIIDGVNITGCTWCDFEPDAEPYCRINDGEDLACEDNPNCYFKQLARKTQECEQLKEKYEALKLENQEGYEIVDELKHKCEELKKQLGTSEEWRIKAEGLNEKLELKNTCYLEALEEIKGIAKNFGSYAAWQEQRINKILDIINKAKGGGECQ